MPTQAYTVLPDTVAVVCCRHYLCDSRQHLFEGAIIPLASLWILMTQLAIYQYSIEALSQHTFGTKTSVKTTVVNAKMSPEKTAASILM